MNNQAVIISLMLIIGLNNTKASDLEDLRQAPNLLPAVHTSYGVRYARPLDASTVEVCIGISYSPAAENPESYRIISYDDEKYAYKKFIRPAAVKVKSVNEAKGTGTIKTYKRNLVTLTLTKPMQKGKKYYIMAQGKDGMMVTACRTAGGFIYDGKPIEAPSNEVDLAVMGLRKIEPVGDGIIRLAFGSNFSANAAKHPNNYTIKINGTKVAVINFGMRTMVETYIPTGWPFKGISYTDVYLKLAPKYKDGDKIEVKVSPKITGAANSASITYHDKQTFSNSIKVNQIGYLTNSPVKMAYLGKWLGSYPEMAGGSRQSGNSSSDPRVKAKSNSSADRFVADVKNSQKQTLKKPKLKDEKAAVDEDAPNPSLLLGTPPEFHVCDAKTGKVVFTGKSKLVHTSGQMNEGYYLKDHSGENVYQLDFTKCKKPGRYFISIGGVGRSLDFNIDDNVYKKAFKIQSHGMYIQRCGIELKPPYSEWHRIACHNKGIIPTNHVFYDTGAFMGHNKTPDINFDSIDASKSIPELDKLNSDPALLAHWKLNGNFKDSGKSKLNMKPQGKSPKFISARHLVLGENKAYGPTPDEGKFGGIADNVPCDIKNGFTMSGWMNYKNGSNFGGIVMGLGENGWKKSKIVITAGWGVLSAVAGTTGRAIKYKRIGDGWWHHLALVILPGEKDQEVILYGDGKEIGRNKVGGEVNPSMPFKLAAFKGKEAGGKFFDDIRLYNRNLSPAEIKTLATKWGANAVKLNIVGGHHDAGDYNPRSHIDVAWNLMDAYEIAPQKFYDGQLNIPENKNGLPDILDEAYWALKLWLGLQTADGGVMNGTESEGDPNFIQTVELDPLGDYAYAKDAVGSFKFAAVMAQAARCWKMAGKDRPEFLQGARKAYAWANAHPPKKIKNSRDYARKWNDPKAYAAAEMLLTTGEKKFNDDFKAVCVWSIKPDADLEVYRLYSQKRAAWAYARCSKNVDKALQENIRKQIINWADWEIKFSSTMAYAFIRHPHAPINWGSGSSASWLPCIWWAWKLTGDQKYYYWMIRTADNILGANPMGITYVTGMGPRSVLAPLHNSRYNPTGEVVPGCPVQGPNYKGNGYRLREMAYPKIRSDFASLYTFADNHFCIAMDEGTAPLFAKNMALFGLLLPDKK